MTSEVKLEPTAEEIERVDTAITNEPFYPEDTYDSRVARAAILAMDRRAEVVPEGWKLVPVEPTWEMQLSGRDAILAEEELSTDDALSAYRAMLAAAPEPPTTRSEAEAVRPIDEWHEDYGPVVWWSMDPVTGDWRGEPAFIGSPLGSDWVDDYYTHWTPHPAFPPVPAPPAP